VGDYDESAPPEASLQLREVRYVTRWGNLVTLALLKEPVTLPGFVPANLGADGEAPAAGGDLLTFVGYHGGFLPTGYETHLNVTSRPGPALEAAMEAVEPDACERATQTSRDYVLCARPLQGGGGADDPPPAFPCGGKWLVHWMLDRLGSKRGHYYCFAFAQPVPNNDNLYPAVSSAHDGPARL
jgi:hypothetical protein